MNASDGRIAKEVMDIRGVAAYLGLGKSKIYGLIRDRKIPASRIGRQYRFSKDVIDAWLRDNLITRPEGVPSKTGGTVDRR
ncbi:MAG: helix-turn-helix domain-containing protein [Elusimicrobia bacterium]|nr:helix-turn-helix domain-containing protein [Elusimicrobiota bacterium]MBP9127686.1 helix-turn-helix domain-containing protein [Elusimicrobiota bacterium]MBP9699639.1 helix-turn-helix domain-containing protein [Elusimicrobiota bacterium]